MTTNQTAPTAYALIISARIAFADAYAIAYMLNPNAQRESTAKEYAARLGRQYAAEYIKSPAHIPGSLIEAAREGRADAEFDYRNATPRTDSDNQPDPCDKIPGRDDYSDD